MAKIFPQRMTAEIDGDFVVFLIGMRINRPWKFHKWLPVFFAMPRMLKELAAKPESGFLGAMQGFPIIVQYWRSFDHRRPGMRRLLGRATRREIGSCRRNLLD